MHFQWLCLYIKLHGISAQGWPFFALVAHKVLSGVTCSSTPKPLSYSLYSLGSGKMLLIFWSKQILFSVNFPMRTWVKEGIYGLSSVMVLNWLTYHSCCKPLLRNSLSIGKDAVWRQGTPRNLHQGHFLCLSHLMSILNVAQVGSEDIGLF